jgi:hypothetical protein
MLKFWVVEVSGEGSLFDGTKAMFASYEEALRFMRALIEQQIDLLPLAAIDIIQEYKNVAAQLEFSGNEAPKKFRLRTTGGDRKYSLYLKTADVQITL